MTNRVSRRLAAGLMVAAATGCGGPTKVVVEGRLTADGRPVTPSFGEVEVVFHPAGPGGNPKMYTYQAELEPDGRYAVRGWDRGGIPIDRYRVVVAAFSGGRDKLRSAYSAEESPLEFDVSAANRVIDLDVKVPAKN